MEVNDCKVTILNIEKSTDVPLKFPTNLIELDQLTLFLLFKLLILSICITSLIQLATNFSKLFSLFVEETQIQELNSLFGNIKLAVNVDALTGTSHLFNYVTHGSSIYKIFLVSSCFLAMLKCICAMFTFFSLFFAELTSFTCIFELVMFFCVQVYGMFAYGEVLTQTTAPLFLICLQTAGFLIAHYVVQNEPAIQKW